MKYEITEITMVDEGRTLHRIRALRDIPGAALGGRYRRVDRD